MPRGKLICNSFMFHHEVQLITRGSRFGQLENVALALFKTNHTSSSGMVDLVDLKINYKHSENIQPLK